VMYPRPDESTRTIRYRKQGMARPAECCVQR
jgi:hypothetical protein